MVHNVSAKESRSKVANTETTTGKYALLSTVEKEQSHGVYAPSENNEGVYEASCAQFMLRRNGTNPATCAAMRGAAPLDRTDFGMMGLLDRKSLKSSTWYCFTIIFSFGIPRPVRVLIDQYAFGVAESRSSCDVLIAQSSLRPSE